MMEKKCLTVGCSRAREYVNNSKNFLNPTPTKTQCKARLNACS